MQEPLYDFQSSYDHHLLRPDRLYYALIWWLFWNREAKMPLLWLLRFHRRPFAWERWANKKIKETK